MPTTIKLENRTARLLHISVGRGDFVTVPPLDPPGPVELTLATDADKARLDKALATPIIQAWIAAGELVVGGGAAPTTPTIPSPPTSLTDDDRHTKHRR